MRYATAMIAASVAMLAAQVAEAQSIAQQVARVRDGKVRMTFASRDEICGFANGITTRPGTRNTWGRNYSEDVEYDTDCSEGPARVVLEVRDGRPFELRAHVGGRWRPASNVTDLGTVGVREATAWLLDVARANSGKVASGAIFATTLADSVQMARPLFDFARNESNPREGREQAIFWMHQLEDTRVVGFLERLLREGRDESIQDKAIFSLSQHRSDASRRVLRDYVMKSDAPTKLRGSAIFWLGQSKGEGNEFLRALYFRLDNPDLKDKVIFALSQQRGENAQWLLDLVANGNESIEMRKKALFWAGQGGASVSQLSALYSKLGGREMKDQMIFVLSQKRESAAVDKLMDIARNDPDREARRKALFWLGQSRDPRVATLLSDIINR